MVFVTLETYLTKLLLVIFYDSNAGNGARLRTNAQTQAHEWKLEYFIELFSYLAHGKRGPVPIQ